VTTSDARLAETAGLTPDPPAHPLDPLSPGEIEAATTLLRARQALPDTARFAFVTLEEPDKDEVKGFRPGSSLDRRAFAVVLDKADGRFYEAVVSLSRDRVEWWREVTGDAGQPMLLREELAAVDQIVKADPRWRAAAVRRGVDEVELVQLDPFSAGNFGFAGERGRRLVRAPAYVRHFPEDNGYAHPLEGLIAYVDLNAAEVVELVDVDPVPVPQAEGNYGRTAQIPPRRDLRPLEIVQEQGPSFEIDGHQIRWHKWKLRVSANGREGLVLHQVSYEDGGTERPILYRASISEMVVPYGDPGPGWFWRSAFDEGEYGLGRLANSLRLGCDCLGEIRYMDLVTAGDDGHAVTIENAICVHEEDQGVAWRHSNFRAGTHDVRRQRRLVISLFATVGNYDYGFFWYLYLDGRIEHEVKANGIVQTRAVEPGVPYDWGVVMAEGLAGVHHQHLFCARLDFDLDGERNTVLEVDLERIAPGPGNDHGNAWRLKETALRTELEAQRLADPLAGRYWKIQNTSARNATGAPVAYKLDPEGRPPLLAEPGSPFSRRASFATRHLWVTRHDSTERYAAGAYPNQHPGGDGLPRWTLADRAIEDEDVVVWHSFGLTHVCKPEDWPVISSDSCGFSLHPIGFFDRNPALDLPEPEECGRDGAAQ
jgi:primary-amine oxidase